MVFCPPFLPASSGDTDIEKSIVGVRRSFAENVLIEHKALFRKRFRSQKKTRRHRKYQAWVLDAGDVGRNVSACCRGQKCMILNDIKPNFWSKREFAFFKCVPRSKLIGAHHTVPWPDFVLGRDENRPVAESNEVDDRNKLARLDSDHPVFLPRDPQPMCTVLGPTPLAQRCLDFAKPAMHRLWSEMLPPRTIDRDQEISRILPALRLARSPPQYRPRRSPVPSEPAKDVTMDPSPSAIGGGSFSMITN